jgi:hypothetical protein
MGVFGGTFALKSRFADLIAQISGQTVESDAHFVRQNNASRREKGF